jgi:hypothetical protein
MVCIHWKLFPTMDSTANIPAPQLKTPKRRVRFRLRTLLILFALLCMWLAWLMRGVNEQRRAVAILEEFGAEIRFAPISSFSPWSSILPRSLRQYILEASPDHWKRVTHVTIRSAEFADSNVEVLGALPHLRYLCLSGTMITDLNMKYIGRLKNLRTLSLGDTRVGDAGLEHLSGLRKIDTLDLSSVPITDKGMIHLREMQKLDELYLNATRLTGASLAHLSAIKSLRVLHLRNTEVDGEALTILAQMPNLQIVDLIDSAVSDGDLPHLRKIPSRVLIWLGENQFNSDVAGKLPSNCKVFARSRAQAAPGN